MGKGFSFALMPAGPELSLPGALVLCKIIGSNKTFVFCSPAVLMPTVADWLFGIAV
jgi:uncharacterized membrane protein YraQ (UPF0718 family)